MRKRFHYIGLLLLWQCAGPASAQDRNEPAVDTLVTVTEVRVADNADTTRFDKLGQPAAVMVRPVSKRVLDSLLADEDYWYANVAPQKKKAEEPRTGGDSLFRQRWFRDLLWFLILGSFIGVVIWYLISSNILLFRRKAKNIAAEEGEEVVTDDIFSFSYEKEIEKAVAARNYRLAVRLRYLQLLKLLSEKGRIDYRYGRTNHDYVLQLYKTPYYRDFSRLTRNFEYTWYGQFDLSAEAYEMMRHDFSTFQNALR